MALSTAYTGARQHDYLKGYYSEITKGSMLQVLCDVKPMKRHTSTLEDGYSLGTVSWLRTMSPSERLEYVKSRAEDNENSIGHGITNHAVIKVLQVGAGIAERIGQDVANDIIGKEFSTKEFEDLFPRAVGSKAQRHTLVLIRQFWSVNEDYHIETEWKGPTLDIVGCKILNGCFSKCFVYNGFATMYENLDGKWVRPAGAVTKVAIKYPTEPALGTDEGPETALKLAETLGYDTSLKNYVKGFTPATHKSLMQKIIRFRALNVVYPDGTTCPTKDCLITCLALLADHPGSFVPDIQRFVGGLESMAKRLAICIYEDSYGEPEWLLSLLSGALLAQLDRTWKPSAELMKTWFDYGVAALESPKKLDVDFWTAKDDKPFVFSGSNSTLENCSAILDVLKAFHCDYGLTRAWVTRCKGEILGHDRPEYMPLGHCVDHHWAPHLVHLWPIDSLKTFKTHAEMIDHIWVESSRINSRCGLKKPCDMVAKVQLEFLKKMNGVVGDRRRVTGDVEVFDVELSDSWLAGAVGPIELKVSGDPMTITTINTRNINELLVIKRPARGKPVPITDAQVKRGKAQALAKLKAGVKTSFGVVKAVGKGSSILYTVNGEDWNNHKKKVVEIPVVERGEGSGLGLVDPNKDYCGGWSIKVLRRALMYLSHYRPKFELKKISRDGKGSDVIDCEVFRYFEFLHEWAPGAIEAVGVGKYRVPNIYMMMLVRSSIETYLHQATGTSEFSWSFIEDLRPLWRHQVSMVNDLLNATTRGSFIWAPVGSGKTKVVMTYLTRLAERGSLPDYVLYTLPKSAIESVKKEILKFTKNVVVVSPLKTSKLKTPYKGYINLIDHDHLRRFETLDHIAPKSLLIVDEVHKTLNDTIRTSVAVELGHSAVKFVVMTGTPIIDSNTHKLIPWLEQIVDFKVDDKNFWVAANGMISCKFESLVKAEWHSSKCEISSDYYNYVPPALGGKNHNPNSKDKELALKYCYDACDTAIINCVAGLVDSGRGVMVVAKDKAHRAKLTANLSVRVGTQSVHEMVDPIVLDSESKLPYKVVVVTTRQSEGYTLTKLSAMVTSVYPSNDATRQQLEGRINRIGQAAKQIDYHTFHAGFLSEVFESHNKARGISAALSGFAKLINY